MTRVTRIPWLATFVLSVGATPLCAQTVGAHLVSAVPVISPPWRSLADTSGPSWMRPIASALVPGTGQLLGRKDRGVAYLVVEAFLITRFYAFTSEARRERQRYRDLAYTVARAGFDRSSRDTSFAYFEQLTKFNESGPFNTAPGPELLPPTDETTFNGSIWALARRTFFPDPDDPPPPDSPEYQRALQFYYQRAAGVGWEWSWTNASLEHELYRRSIRQSDTAFRRASQQLGLILANHVVSAVDVFMTERLAKRAPALRFETTLAPDRAGAELPEVRVGVRVEF